MKIGIIGGGLTGLSAGYYLSKRGHEVTIFERSQILGGLASSFKFNQTNIEKYFHHIFTRDRHIIDLIEELGIGDRFFWNETSMGFFYGGEIYKFNTPIDLLKFKPLNLLERLKFGISIFYLQKLENWKKLENVTAEEWLIKNFGENNYNTIWKPLLRIKFGEKYKIISAAWIWGRVKPRANSRSKGKEKLGYLEGGFQILIETLKRNIKENGGKILIGKPVEKIIIKKSKVVDIQLDNGLKEFDKIISTIPLPLFLKISEELPKSYIEDLEKIEYQSILCMVLILNRSLSDIYWLNITDSTVPFGGVIEHTNFIPKRNYHGASVVYLFNYLPKNHELYTISNEELFSIYKRGLKKVFPDFSEKWVEKYLVFRDSYGTPIYTKNYSKQRPSHTSPIKNLYIANTSQIYPEDRNMNNSIKLGRYVAEEIVESTNG